MLRAGRPPQSLTRQLPGGVTTLSASLTLGTSPMGEAGVVAVWGCACGRPWEPMPLMCHFCLKKPPAEAGGCRDEVVRLSRLLG